MRMLMLIFLCLLPFSAGAQAWQGPAEGQVRLVQLNKAETPFGIEIRLAPGWHTYWALPGDAGLPPRVQIGGIDVDVHFPKPLTFDESGMMALGYERRVILPLGGTFVPGQTISIDYGVCAEICLPAYQELTVPARAPQLEAPIVPTIVDQPISASIAGSLIVLEAADIQASFLAVGKDYAVPLTRNVQGRLVADLGANDEAARAATMPLQLYQYAPNEAHRYTVEMAP